MGLGTAGALQNLHIFCRSGAEYQPVIVTIVTVWKTTKNPNLSWRRPEEELCSALIIPKTPLVLRRASSGLTSHLAVVMYKCTLGPRDITVRRGYRPTEGSKTLLFCCDCLVSLWFSLPWVWPLRHIDCSTLLVKVGAEWRLKWTPAGTTQKLNKPQL